MTMLYAGIRAYVSIPTALWRVNVQSRGELTVRGWRA